MYHLSYSPLVVRHGNFYRNVIKFYALDIYYDGHLLERHLFTRKSEFYHMYSSLSDVIPQYSKIYNGLSYDAYHSVDISFLDSFENLDC